MPFQFDDPEDSGFVTENQNHISEFEAAKESFLGARSVGEQIEKLIYRYQMSEEFEGNEALKPEELNKLYPELQGRFEVPMTKSVAEDIAEEHRRKARLQETLSQAGDGLLAKTGTFLGEVAGGTGPEDILVGMLGGMAVKGLTTAAAARAGSMGFTRTAKVLTAGATSDNLLAQGAREFVEDFSASMVLNEPINMIASESDLEDYSLTDAFISASASAFASTGLVVGVKGLFRGGSAMFNRATRANPEVHVDNTINAINNISQDIPVNAFDVIDELLEEQNGRPLATIPGVQDGPSFSSILEDVRNPKSLEDVPSLYVATRGISTDFSQDIKHKIDIEMGNEGIHLTDDPVVANSVAASRHSETSGEVVEVKQTAPLNLIDLEQPLEAQVRAVYEKHLGSERSKSVDWEASGKQAAEIIEDLIEMGSLPKSVYKAINDELRALGFDGVHYEGTGKSKKNSIFLFDESKVKPQKKAKAEKKHTEAKTKTAKAGRPKAKAKTSMDYDDDLVDDFIREYVEGGKKDIDKEMDKAFDEERLDMEAREMQGILDPDELKALEELREQDAWGKTEEVLTKGALSCLLRS